MPICRSKSRSVIEMDERAVGMNLEKTRDGEICTMAAQQARKFYNDNTPLCTEAHEYYKRYCDHLNEYVCPPIQVDATQLRCKVDGQVILVVTSNEIEEGVFLRFYSEQTKSPIPSFMVIGPKPQVYHVIKMGKYTIVHTHTKRTGDEFTRRTINQDSQIFCISHIVLLGICYGIDYTKQKMCSAVIADDVRGYRVNFRDNVDGETTFEPEIEFEERPDSGLIGTITNFSRYCQPTRRALFCEKGSSIHVEVGKVLSANCLMSSEQVKKAVVESIGDLKNRPLGGEMEACGIFKSTIFEKQGFRKWLLIKSICDWGAGKNSLCPEDTSKGEQIKNALQSLAMSNSCEVFKWLLDEVHICERGK